MCKKKLKWKLTEKSREGCCEYCQPVLLPEPGPKSDEGEVEGGGGGEEGRARQEHTRRHGHHAQAQPANICTERCQDPAVKINLDK